MNASRLVNDWYTSTLGIIKDVDDELAQTALQRIDTHTRKLALLYAMLENDDNDYEIHADQFNTASMVGNYWIRVAFTIYSQFAKNDQSRAEQSILRFLKSAGGPCKKRQIQRAVHLNAKELNESLKALAEAELIELVSGRRRDTMMVRLFKD